MLGYGVSQASGEPARAVPQWSGREVRALRVARRMSVRAFAAHLGVSDRMVSKWEAGGLKIRPRPINQAALDTSLAQASDEVRTRFASMADGRVSRPSRARVDPAPAAPVHLVRHPEDGKLMTLVEAGPCPLGPDDLARWLTGFYIDVYPTSNADYARFVAATGRAAPPAWGGPEPPADRLHHPVVTVTWADAQAYATWTAKALPTGAEWEKAARGAEGATYPWGEHAGVARANVREARIRSTTPVDRYDNGISPYGVYDLCGNVAEWCAGSGQLGALEVRGGGFDAPLHQCRPAHAVHVAERECRPDLGFRCVVSASAMHELLVV